MASSPLSYNQSAAAETFGPAAHYEFFLDRRRHRGSTGTANKPQAIQEERSQRERLETRSSKRTPANSDGRRSSKRPMKVLLDYKVKHGSATFAEYALGHVTDHLSGKLVVEITPPVVKRYRTDRLAAIRA